MKKLNLSIALSLTLVAACSVTLPVRGELEKSNEVFSGTATGHLDGAGELTLVSTNGAACKGHFVYVSARGGEGILTCADGRTGPFSFVSTGMRGVGHGELSGARFTFTFGS
jgi:hypothetical protein